MADDRLPFLRGRVSAVDTYESPQGGGGGGVRLPSLDPAAHRTRLLQQLDAIERQVQSRAAGARDERASREIVAVRPAPGTELAPDQLDHANSDARLIGTDADTGTVILDVAAPRLDHLRRKLDLFGDDTRIKIKQLKDGSVSVHRASERAVAPIESIGLADLADVRGPHLRAATLDDSRAYWFEIGCRGGYRRPAG